MKVNENDRLFSQNILALASWNELAAASRMGNDRRAIYDFVMIQIISIVIQIPIKINNSNESGQVLCGVCFEGSGSDFSDRSMSDIMS